MAILNDYVKFVRDCRYLICKLMCLLPHRYKYIYTIYEILLV